MCINLERNTLWRTRGEDLAWITSEKAFPGVQVWRYEIVSGPRAGQRGQYQNYMGHVNCTGDYGCAIHPDDAHYEIDTSTKLPRGYYQKRILINEARDPVKNGWPPRVAEHRDETPRAKTIVKAVLITATWRANQAITPERIPLHV